MFSGSAPSSRRALKFLQGSDSARHPYGYAKAAPLRGTWGGTQTVTNNDACPSLLEIEMMHRLDNCKESDGHRVYTVCNSEASASLHSRLTPACRSMSVSAYFGTSEHCRHLWMQREDSRCSSKGMARWNHQVASPVST